MSSLLAGSAEEPQHVKWVKWLDNFKATKFWQPLPDEAKAFVETFRRNLIEYSANVSPGDRRRVEVPFTRAIAELIGRWHGEVTSVVPAVKIADDVTKTADLAIIIGGTKWVIEIKTGLDFNSLGAAALEALALQAAEPESKYMLVALYAKDSAGREAEAILNCCGLGELFDLIGILSCKLPNDQWDEDFAKRLVDFVHRLSQLT